MKTTIDLTDGFPLKVDVDRMLKELKGLEDKNWLAHYDTQLADGWTAIPLISLDGQIGNSEAQRPGTFDQYKPTVFYDSLPYIKEIIEFFECPKGRVRLMKLEAGGRVGAHRDINLEVANLAFNQVRLHIPICTNEDVFFFIGREKVSMKAGRIYYANFSKVHSVVNEGRTARIHLMLDLKVNDWLAQFFPPRSPWEKMEHLIVRRSLPVFWTGQAALNGLQHFFWAHYYGSFLQQIYHRLKVKNVSSFFSFKAKIQDDGGLI